MTHSRSAFLMLMLALSALPAGMARAQALPIDDSRSQVMASTVKLGWDDASPQSRLSSVLTGSFTVVVRLDVSAWRGRRGRIYHVLPAQPATPIRASWTTQGLLTPGVMKDGERALVYSGVIDTDLIEDTLRMTIQADGNRLSRQEQLRFSFEFEPELP